MSKVVVLCCWECGQDADVILEETAAPWAALVFKLPEGWEWTGPLEETQHHEQLSLCPACTSKDEGDTDDGNEEENKANT